MIHASLPYDEEVFLWTPEDGYGFYAIGEIVENERSARAVSFDPKTLRVRTHQVTDYITNPTKRIYRVTLESGRAVHVTQDHNLFTLDEHGGVTRIPSEDAEGTRVMVPGDLPSPSGDPPALELRSLLDPEETTVYAADGGGEVESRGSAGARRHDRDRDSAPAGECSPRDTADEARVAVSQRETTLTCDIEVTPEFGWVLGCYIAAGSVRRKQLRIVSTDEEYLDRVAAWFDQHDADLSWDEAERATTLTVRSPLWAEVFRELAGAKGGKNIPAQAWNWPDAVLAALLEGLLAGNGDRRDGRETLYTANGELANRTMYLAGRLGLQSSMGSRDRETDTEPGDETDHGTEWAIDVSADVHDREQYVPIPTELLRALRDGAGLDRETAAEAMGNASKSSITKIEEGHDDVKRSTLRQFRDVYAEHGADTTRLDQLLDGDVRFERVESVEQTDRVEPTYDLEVQPNGRAIENFLGGRGGVFLSNTAGVIDPGYRGQITLELSNLGTAPVALTPDMRISQIILTELSSPAERPYGSERGSKYQDQAGPQASRIQSDNEFGGDQP
ncbi:MAG: helix-turn-helix domain-containing protein [Halobacteriales archaeon]|nr:helix-turn-helix domain-containing protein [Halobacteriales archaeon]